MLPATWYHMIFLTETASSYKNKAIECNVTNWAKKTISRRPLQIFWSWPFGDGYVSVPDFSYAAVNQWLLHFLGGCGDGRGVTSLGRKAFARSGLASRTPPSSQYHASSAELATVVFFLVVFFLLDFLRLAFFFDAFFFDIFFLLTFFLVTFFFAAVFLPD